MIPYGMPEHRESRSMICWMQRICFRMDYLLELNSQLEQQSNETINASYICRLCAVLISSSHSHIKLLFDLCPPFHSTSSTMSPFFMFLSTQTAAAEPIGGDGDNDVSPGKFLLLAHPLDKGKRANSLQTGNPFLFCSWSSRRMRHCIKALSLSTKKSSSRAYNPFKVLTGAF